MDGIPPPQVHMHIRKFDVSKEVPIGDLSATNPSVIPNGNSKPASHHSDPVETDILQAEKDKFDLWLRELWRQKDQDIARYLKTGSFVAETREIFEIPVALKRKREALDAFCFFIPAFLGWLFSRIA